jgi:hypothetical protein
MMELIERFWFSNRNAVSEDTDKLLAYIANRLKADIIEAKCG